MVVWSSGWCGRLVELLVWLCGQVAGVVVWLSGWCGRMAGVVVWSSG